MATVFIPEIKKPVHSDESMFLLIKKHFASLTDAFFRPQAMVKPEGVHLPDRVWRRHSAMIISMNEQKKY